MPTAAGKARSAIVVRTRRPYASTGLALSVDNYGYGYDYGIRLRGGSA